MGWVLVLFLGGRAVRLWVHRLEVEILGKQRAEATDQGCIPSIKLRQAFG